MPLIPQARNWEKINKSFDILFGHIGGHKLSFSLLFSSWQTIYTLPLNRWTPCHLPPSTILLIMCPPPTLFCVSPPSTVVFLHGPADKDASHSDEARFCWFRTVQVAVIPLDSAYTQSGVCTDAIMRCHRQQKKLCQHNTFLKYFPLKHSSCVISMLLWGRQQKT